MSRTTVRTGVALLLGASLGSCRCQQRLDPPRIQILNPAGRLTRARCTGAEPLAVLLVELRNQSPAGRAQVSIERGTILDSPSHRERLSMIVESCKMHLGFGFADFDGVIAAGQSRELVCKFVPPPDAVVAQLDHVVIRAEVTAGVQTFAIATPPLRVETCSADDPPGVTGAPAPPAPPR